MIIYANAWSQKILVVGDVILDISYKGKVNRVSPEAPIPALCMKKWNTLLAVLQT